MNKYETFDFIMHSLLWIWVATTGSIAIVVIVETIGDRINTGYSEWDIAMQLIFWSLAPGINVVILFMLLKMIIDEIYSKEKKHVSNPYD